MSKEQELKRVIEKYKAGIAFVLDDADEVYMSGHGTNKDIVESIVSSVYGGGIEQNITIKTILFKTVAALLLSDKEDMKTFFLMLNTAIEDEDKPQTKYVKLPKPKK